MARTPQTVADKWQTIDPGVLGRRIRNARTGARLTQHAAAAGVVSTAYLSRIESGDRRPSLAVLDQLAERMGITAEQLLFDAEVADHTGLQLSLARAERLLAKGRTDDALADAQMLELAAAAANLHDLHDEALLLQARCKLALGALREAAELLEEIVEPTHSATASVRASAVLCRCYTDLEDFDAALRVIMRGVGLVAALRLSGLPEAIELAAEAARLHLRMGHDALARAVCEAALADVADDPGAMVSTLAYAISTEQTRGDYATAARHSSRAASIIELETYRSNISFLRDHVS